MKIQINNKEINLNAWLLIPLCMFLGIVFSAIGSIGEKADTCKEQFTTGDAFIVIFLFGALIFVSIAGGYLSKYKKHED